ncbi:erythroblast NAD(P)(+)--arginine ADP-ribosyltransferase-like [Ammospiza nelsoni]|uniref:erythroblast NAD(P)(+)--arginine ADP-ribosyltransferase-like n=1 Tax=Ammospiza nelsoni TaxID=2857394 RepID=UPI002869C66C|nr:erythroblast NAD(P)(+)--arginine ADP-ribosyltransferase-like [Ammospiza nelsoni]
MAPLAQTLALLAMAMATMALDVYRLDMAPDSFDDQYQGCVPAMKAALPALNRSEFEQNKEFAEVWVKAAAEWQSRGPPESPLSAEQATAIMAFSMTDPRTFNDVLRVVGHSRHEYRDNFHFKTLHFLLTDALATLRDAQKGQCRDAFLKVCDTRFETQPGETIRFGHFMPVLSSKQIGECPGETMLELRTCHGVEIQFFIEHPEPEIVLIPPFETFKVTQYTLKGDKTQIQLQSTGTYSKYNCEWLRGGNRDRKTHARDQETETGFSQGLVCLQSSFPPRRTPDPHSLGSGHQDPLSHEAIKVTKGHCGHCGSCDHQGHQHSLIPKATTAALASVATKTICHSDNGGCSYLMVATAVMVAIVAVVALVALVTLFL